MADTMTAEQRHRCMSRIRGKDTKPEMIVRRFLWDNGFRYRLHVRKLPGSPDIVMRKHKIVIFVNGCFWHGHNARPLPDDELANSECCKIPHSNRRFWLDKINRNMLRDLQNLAKLKEDGWRVITIWECELKPRQRTQTLQSLQNRLNEIIGIPARYDLPEEKESMAAESQPAYNS